MIVKEDGVFHIYCDTCGDELSHFDNTPILFNDFYTAVSYLTDETNWKSKRTNETTENYCEDCSVN